MTIDHHGAALTRTLLSDEFELSLDLNSSDRSTVEDVSHWSAVTIQSTGTPWTTAVIEWQHSINGTDWLPLTTQTAPGLIQISLTGYKLLSALVTTPEGAASLATLTCHLETRMIADAASIGGSNLSDLLNRSNHTGVIAPGEISPQGTGSTLDADLLDGNEAAAFAGASHTHAAADINSGTLADARVAESNVTQHEAAVDHDALTNFTVGEHRIINDAGTSATELWSASKINSLVYGKNYQQVESVERQTTTSTTFLTKVTLVTGALTGTFRIGANALVDNIDIKPIALRIQNTSDATTISEAAHTPSHVDDSVALTMSDEIVLAGVSKTIELQYSATAEGGAVGIQGARLEFWRVV